MVIYNDFQISCKKIVTQQKVMFKIWFVKMVQFWLLFIGLDQGFQKKGQEKKKDKGGNDSKGATRGSWCQNMSVH